MNTVSEQPEAGRIADQKKGLYRKYRVERLDGSSGPGGKHEHCEYFVLDLVHDKFAQPALRAYASACAAEYPALAADLMQKAGGDEPANAEAVRVVSALRSLWRTKDGALVLCNASVSTIEAACREADTFLRRAG